MKNRIRLGRGLAPRLVPQVEALEDRWLPSCTAVIMDLDPVVDNGVHDFALIVKGDAADNVVTITDNGAAGITVICDGEDITPANIGDFDISKILVDMGRGNDTINYNLGAVDGLNRIVVLDGGQGDNEIFANFGDIADSVFALTAQAGKGHDYFAIAFDGIISNSMVNVAVEGGMGNDIIDLTMVGALEGETSVSIALDGGQGDDILNVNATGLDIGEDALLALALFAGKHNDEVSVTYQGQVNGSLNLLIEGGQGDDLVDANLTVETGSTGSVEAHVEGGKGDDDLTLNIFADDDDDLLIDATLDAGPGEDVCTATDNVVTSNC